MTAAFPEHPDNRKIKPKMHYTVSEEIANAATHGIGVALGIIALIVLITYGGNYRDTWRVVCFSIYGASLILLYLASTLYHASSNERIKHFFRMMDHSFIFVLIAGTYTPVTLIAMRGAWGWTLFCLIWIMAASGLIYELLYLGRHKAVSLSIYASMGWLAIIAIKPMLDLLPAGLLAWIFIGGLLYSLGIVFYVWKKLPYNHAIWHLFVLGGSTAHFFAVLLYLSASRA